LPKTISDLAELAFFELFQLYVNFIVSKTTKIGRNHAGIARIGFVIDFVSNIENIAGNARCLN
jgi:hypothetical protein